MRTINEIKRIEIKGLFGFLNYDIELSGKGIDIITGPNGSGKTTIMRLVIAVLEQDLEGLARACYNSITVHAATHPYEIQTLKPRVRNVNISVLTEIKIHIENHHREVRFIIDDIDIGAIYKRIRPGYEDEATGEVVEESFLLDPSAQMHQKLGVFYVPQRVTVLNLSRIAAEGSQQIETSIEDEVSVDLSPINLLLRDSISRASQVLLDSVATSSQVLVDSLVTRKGPKAKNLTEAIPLSELSLNQIEHEFRRLKSQFVTVGVRLDTSVLDSFFAGEVTRRKEYSVNDGEISPVAERYVRTLVAGYQKAAVHTERIFGFITQINAAMPRYKSIVVHFSGSGIARIKVNQINPTSGETIEISKGLSSGEHRLLKLYGSLLLNTPTTFYFIDEPEISLHPSWIRELVTGLSSIRGTSQYFIASHSPTLVSKHKDLHNDLHMLLLNEGSNNNDHQGTEK